MILGDFGELEILTPEERELRREQEKIKRRLLERADKQGCSGG